MGGIDPLNMLEDKCNSSENRSQGEARDVFATKP